MDFGSEYILNEEEEEEIEASYSPQKPIRDEDLYYGDSSGFECEIMDFDEDEEIETQNIVKEKKVNTNTVRLDMNKLKEEPDVKVEITKLVTCAAESCGAAYSHLAKKDVEKQVWTCNFCGHANKIDKELPDLSDKSDVMYVEDTSKVPELTPPESSKQKIIFVIDTSSSMCQTKPMDLSQASPTLQTIIYQDNQRQYAIQQQFTNSGGQPLLAITSGKVEVSRLQAIKSSVIDVIDKLSKSEQKDTRVGLVTFHENVTVYGDGSKVLNVEGNELLLKTELEIKGRNERNLRPLHESADSLKEKIASLDELGRTALGPALVIAQAMAADAEGSKVILCTDGVANIGLGRLEDTTEQEIDKFYSEVITDSILSGVSVTLLCVDNAGLDTRLGQVPTETGGMLEKIEAKQLDAKLSEDLSRVTVAVNTDMKFIVHKDLYVNDTKASDSKRNTYVQKIGNLQLDKPVSFSFAFKSSNAEEESPSKQPKASDNLQAVPDDQCLPFQFIVTYRTLAGGKVVRVWTSERKMTKNRAQAEHAMNKKTTIENFLQQSSQQMLERIYEKKDLVDKANVYSNEGQDHLKKLGTGGNLGTVEIKLKQFIALMNEIVRKRRHTEEQIVELNKFKEARSGGVKG